MSDIGNAPEPSRQEVADAFGGDVADVFKQIREKQMAEGMICDEGCLPQDWHKQEPTVRIAIPKEWPWETAMVELVQKKKIKVPEGMLKAAIDASHQANRPCPEFAFEYYRPILEAALRWLSEHPSVPTDEQWKELVKDWERGRHPMEAPSMEDIYPLWASHMFTAPEPEVPDAVKDLLMIPPGQDGHPDSNKFCADVNSNILEAFQRGQKSSK